MGTVFSRISSAFNAYFWGKVESKPFIDDFKYEDSKRSTKTLHHKLSSYSKDVLKPPSEENIFLQDKNNQLKRVCDLSQTLGADTIFEGLKQGIQLEVRADLFKKLAKIYKKKAGPLDATLLFKKLVSEYHENIIYEHRFISPNFDSLSLQHANDFLIKLQFLKEQGATNVFPLKLYSVLEDIVNHHPLLGKKVFEIFQQKPEWSFTAKIERMCCSAAVRQVPLPKHNNQQVLDFFAEQKIFPSEEDMLWRVRHHALSAQKILPQHLPAMCFEAVKRNVSKLLETKAKSTAMLEKLKSCGGVFTKDHLQVAIENRNARACAWLLKNLTLTDTELSEYTEQAVQSKAIKVVECLAPKEVVTLFLQSIPSRTAEKFSQFLQILYVVNSVAEVHALAKRIISALTIDEAREFKRANRDAFKEFRRFGGQIARYLGENSIARLYGVMDSKLNQAQNDIAFGEAYYNAVEKMVKGEIKKDEKIDFSELPKGTKGSTKLREFLEIAATVHQEEAKFRKNKDADFFATLFSNTNRAPRTLIAGRYAVHEPLVKMMFSQQEPDIKTEKSGYSLYYPLDGKKTCISKVYYLNRGIPYGSKSDIHHWCWCHGVALLKTLWPRLEDLFEELLDFKLTSKNTRKFYEKLSEFQWLFAHATPMKRGSGKYGEMLLAFLHLKKGVLPPILKKNLQWDGVLLSMPLSIFQRIFAFLFEPETLDLLKFKSFAAK